jgi:hypothetical protein
VLAFIAGLALAPVLRAVTRLAVVAGLRAVGFFLLVICISFGSDWNVGAGPGSTFWIIGARRRAESMAC